MKPEALWFNGESDVDGMFTLRCKDKKTAIKAMLELWIDDPTYHEERYGKDVISEERVKEDRMWTCRSCSFYSMGEAVCIQCGHNFTSNGRQTFVIYFKKK